MADKKVEMGLLLHIRHLIRAAATPADFNSLWTQVRRAEEIGFDHNCLGNSVMVLNKARGDSLTTLVALAMYTETVRLGIVPLLAHLRNPLHFAHALATLDVISKARVVLGVSAGGLTDYIKRQFAACGVPPEEKAGRLSESIALMRRLWTEESFDFKGKYSRFENTGILPRPIQATIPILIAAAGNDTALKRVARLGDGWFTSDVGARSVHRAAADD